MSIKCQRLKSIIDLPCSYYCEKHKTSAKKIEKAHYSHIDIAPNEMITIDFYSEASICVEEQVYDFAREKKLD